MKAVDIRSKSDDELGQMVLDLRKEQFNLRFQKTTGQQENTARSRIVRRDIARIKTILSERLNDNVPVKDAKKAPAKKATTKKVPAKKAAPKKTTAKKTTANKDKK